MRLDRIKNTKRNLIFGVTFRVVNIILPFLNRTIVLYLLGAAYLGLSSLFSSILGILNLAELGFGSAMVYCMYKPIAENDDNTIAALLELYKKVYRWIGIIILSVGVLLSFFLKQLINGEVPVGVDVRFVYYIQLINVVISYFFFAYKTSIISAYQREDVLSKVSIVITILLNVMQLTVLFVTRDYYLYLIVMPITTIIGNVVKYYIASKMFPVCNIKALSKLDDTQIDEIKVKVKALFLHKIGGTITNSLDNIVISAFLGLEVIAVYNNYYYIILSLTNIMGIFYTSILAGLGNSIVIESKEKNYIKFKKLTYVNNLIIGLFSICLLCLYQPFMFIWTGKAFMFEFDTVVLFVFYFYINMSRRIIVTFKDATGMWEADRFKPLISGIINACLNIVLIQVIGINGVLISTIVAFAIVEYPWETIVLFDGYFHQKKLTYYCNQIKDFFVIVFIAIIVYFATNLISVSGLLGLILKGGVCLLLAIPSLALIWRSRLSVIKEYVYVSGNNNLKQ